MANRIKPVKLEDVRVLFRNFSGEEGQYNRKGDRNFAVALPEDKAEEMLQEGWNVKRLKPREGEDFGTAYVSVAINYSNRPPMIYLVTRRMGKDIKILMPEDQLDALDWIDIAYADVTLNPFQWEVNGNSGVKAYLKSLVVIQEVDELLSKYDHIEEVGAGRTPLAIEGGDEEVLEGEIIDD